MKQIVFRLLNAAGVYWPLERTTRIWRSKAMIQRHQPVYRPFVPQGGLVFDIGANLGVYTRLFRSLGARVVAAEPQASCVKHLRRLANRDPDIEVAPYAVGAAPGEAVLHVGGHDMTATLSSKWIRNSRFARSYHADQQQSVRVTTLDDMIKQFGAPDFLKIDVEGFESEVLAGLSERITTVTFELTSEMVENAWECLARLSELCPDYRYRLWLVDSEAWMDSPWLADAAFREAVLTRIRDHPGLVGDVFASCLDQADGDGSAT